MYSDTPPLVSVVTPVYNGEPFLAECIESVLKQTYKHFEYIIVNNCSTDRTLEIASGYADRDSRIQVHSNKEFVGVMENHNIALRLISPKSKYCKVVCADDWIFPDCLMQMVELAEAEPSVGITGSYFMAGKQVMCIGFEYERKIVSGRQICRETLMGGPYVFGAPTSILYRSDLIRRNNDFYPGSNPHADTTACYQALKDSDFGFVHQVLSYARIHPESQTTNSMKLGTINLAMIGDVLRFGPEYMSEKEQEKRLNELMDIYYAFLATNMYKQLGNREFWQHQRTELQKLGLRFSLPRFCKAALNHSARLLMKPRRVLRKISALITGSANQPETEGRYYEH